MSLVTGLALGLLVMVLGACGLTVFALVLRKREQPEQKQDGHLSHA